MRRRSNVLKNACTASQAYRACMRRLTIGQHLHANGTPQNLIELDAATHTARAEYYRAMRNIRT